jgi:outer membrane protein assembly factor BamB
VDEGHVNLPAPNAPSFICVNKKSGKLLWADGSPAGNILHGQWSSPAYAVIDGVPQVVFAGGDGWLYCFRGDEGKDGKPELLWKFDANPKESKYILGGRGTRNELIATPVFYQGLVYIAVGQDPEHGEGVGHLWCIDPTKRGDISAELAVNLSKPTEPLPARRWQNVIATDNEVARPNPNTGVVWHYSEFDADGDGKFAFEETMHRTIGTCTIANDLLFITDFSGLVHCVDAKTGKPHWTHDLFAASWGTALVVDGKVFVGDEEGKVTIFALAKEKEILGEVSMGSSVYTSPVVANGVLYMTSKTHLFAIQAAEAAEAAK